jgi:phosphate:Na+ symporter
MPLAAGLAIFLFGMQVLRLGFEALFIEKVQHALRLFTKDSFRSFITGISVTALLQSSSAVTLIVIALVHSRLLSLKHAIAIILGANIGTCITIELLSFKPQAFGTYFFIMGAILFLMPLRTLRGSGMIVGGLGLLFMGMETMQTIGLFLKENGFENWLFQFKAGNDFILAGITAGAVFTALIQSSSAASVLTMNLYADGLISINTSIAIILGTNIGTCVTAILGCIGMSRAGKQVALAHVLLNVMGVLLFIPLIPVLAIIVIWLTAHEPQQIAHAQALFNILCSLVASPFIHWIEKGIKTIKLHQ